MAKEAERPVVGHRQPYTEENSPRRRRRQPQQNNDGNTQRKLRSGGVGSPVDTCRPFSGQQKSRTLANHTDNNNKQKNLAATLGKVSAEVSPRRRRTTATTMPDGRTSPKSSHNNNTTTTTTPTNDKEGEVGMGSSSAQNRSSSKPSRRFQLRGSTLKRILSSTFKDLSLGYYISIVMVISFKIFIFANTLNTVMGAKTFYMHWNTSNSIFRIDNTDHIIDVNKGNLAFEYDQVHIICPVYEPGTFDNETEKLIIYNVSKAEYETCRITNANPRIIAVCDKPQKLMYFTITFRPFTPSPGGLEFLPGHDYYFISTSSKDDLHRRIGGRCSTNNMKVVFKVCCGGGGTGSGGGGGGDTLTIGESNRTSSSQGNSRGNTKKALAPTTPLPSVKIWSVPSSPAVVSHRPTINQPVVLQNDFVMTPVQNHSYGGGAATGGGSGGNWQSSTAATKKTLKPSDFDKRANEVVKYDQELNVNEKSTTNEMVAGDAVSWRRQQQQRLGVLGVLAAAVAVMGMARLQWWLY